MKRKILVILLVFSLLIIPSTRNLPQVHATPLLKEPVKWAIKELIKKETKSAAESILVKQGVRTTEKRALEKANERWFQRLTAEEVAGVQKAVEFAVPSGTPGWLKTVVGAGMWISGADLAYEIYDYMRPSNVGVPDSVSYYTTSDYTQNDLTGMVLSSDKIERFKQYRPIYAWLDPVVHSFADGIVVKVDGKFYFRLHGVDYLFTNGYDYENTATYPHYVDSYDWNNGYWSLFALPPEPTSSVDKNFVYIALAYPYGSQIIYALNPSTSEVERKGFLDAAYHSNMSYGYAKVPKSVLEADMSTGVGRYSVLINSSEGGDYEIDRNAKTAPELVPIPDELKEAWPNDSEGVEILFPDPDFFPDTTATIIANPQIVTNPVPEPKPSAQPTVAPNPSAQPTSTPNPSAQPTAEPSPSIEPTPNVDPTPSAVPSTQPTNPPVIGGEDPNPTSSPDDDDDDGYNGPPIDFPETPEEAIAEGWEDVTPPLIKEYKDPKTGTVVKFNTKTWEITYNKYYEVEIINPQGKPIGEIDEIDMEKEIFYEDKAAKGLEIINPSTGLPAQTAQQWAEKQILDKTRKRIDEALKTGIATRATKSGSKIVPDIELIRNFKEFVFRLDGDSADLIQATDNVVNQLREEYPDYKFSATYGGK